MKKLFSLAFVAIFVIFIKSCAIEGEYVANLPKIEGFEVSHFGGNLLFGHLRQRDEVAGRADPHPTSTRTIYYMF